MGAVVAGLAKKAVAGAGKKLAKGVAKKAAGAAKKSLGSKIKAGVAGLTKGQGLAEQWSQGKGAWGQPGGGGAGTAQQAQADTMQKEKDTIEAAAAPNLGLSGGPLQRKRNAGLNPKAKVGGGHGTSNPYPDRSNMNDNARDMWMKKKGY